jgi:hypothetical protein
MNMLFAVDCKRDVMTNGQNLIIWKEIVVAYLKILSPYSSTQTGKPSMARLRIVRSRLIIDPAAF